MLVSHPGPDRAHSFTVINYSESLSLLSVEPSQSRHGSLCLRTSMTKYGTLLFGALRYLLNPHSPNLPLSCPYHILFTLKT
jgi:hypothetical protein